MDSIRFSTLFRNRAWIKSSLVEMAAPRFFKPLLRTVMTLGIALKSRLGLGEQASHFSTLTSKPT